MRGHDFHKVHFRRFPRVPEFHVTEMNICSLQGFLINGNPRILTHLTLYKIELIDRDRLSLDEFPSLVHLEIEYCNTAAVALETFHKPCLTHFLLRDNHHVMRRMAVLADFMARFQTLKSIVMDIPKPYLRPGKGDKLAQAVVQHANGLELLYFTCNGNGLNMSKYGFNDNGLESTLRLLLEAVVKCKQLCQLTIMLRAKDVVNSCKVSSAFNFRSLMTGTNSAH